MAVFRRHRWRLNRGHVLKMVGESPVRDYGWRRALTLNKSFPGTHEENIGKGGREGGRGVWEAKYNKEKEKTVKVLL